MSAAGSGAAYTCAAYGLTIRLPFPCPGLPAAPPEVIPDVTVQEGPVPLNLDAPAAQGPDWQVMPGRYLCRGGRGGSWSRAAARSPCSAHPPVKTRCWDRSLWTGSW